MVLNGLDSVKAISMGNYSRRRKLKWLFEFFLFFFLVFHRSSLFSLAGPLIRHFSRRLLVVLNSHIFVFMVFHAMLFVVYSLSHLTDNKSGSNRTEAESATAAAASGGDSPESLVAPVDDSVAEKNTATSPVNGVSIDATPVAETTAEPSPASPVRPFNSVTETAEITPEIRRYRRTETAEITPEIRRYRRTESERFEENRERGKLRRTKTEIDREDSGEAARFLNTVDEMDIDDFNRKVESFIAEQKLHIGGRISG